MAEPKCLICGCSQFRPCRDGCEWAHADPPVCSVCAGLAPFGHTLDLDGWTVYGPGPEGAKSTIAVVVESEKAAKELAALFNRAFRMGWKLNAALTAKPKPRAKGGKRR